MTFESGNEQEFTGKLTQITLDHLADEHFGGMDLAMAMGMSWSTLNRKVQAISGRHISELIREIHLKKALFPDPRFRAIVEKMGLTAYYYKDK